MKFFGRRAPRRDSGSTVSSQFEGEVHRRSIHHAAGWARDRANAAEHLTVEAAIIDEHGERIVSRAVANSYYGPLSLQSYDDVRHGFQLIFDPPLTAVENENLVIRPAGTQARLEFATIPELPFSLYDDDRLSPIAGYIDEVSLTHVLGWMVNHRDLGNPLDFEVVIDRTDEKKIVAQGKADQPYASVNIAGSGPCGFRIEFSTPLTPEERNGLTIRLPDHDCVLPRANARHGYVDELDQHHAAGWVRDRFRPEEGLEFEVVLASPAGEYQLATGVADNFHAGLAAGVPEDGYHGFHVNFAPPLTPEQIELVSVRVKAPLFIIPFSFS